jgi:hypothetical protein
MEETVVTNPYGANQYTLDPRQKLCWESYINPRSETFGNARQSALKAGYEEVTANQITTHTWFIEKTRRLNMLGKAEKVLDKTLTLEAVNEEGKTDTTLLKIQTDVAKHITSTLGKNEGYSTRSEISGPNGDAIDIKLSNEDKEKLDLILNEQRSS